MDDIQLPFLRGLESQFNRYQWDEWHSAKACIYTCTRNISLISYGSDSPLRRQILQRLDGTRWPIIILTRIRDNYYIFSRRAELSQSYHARWGCAYSKQGDVKYDIGAMEWCYLEIPVATSYEVLILSRPIVQDISRAQFKLVNRL